MAHFALEQGIANILAIVAAHLIAGIVLGTWFRFGALLPAFAIVLIESLVGDFRLGIAPWYLLFVAGVVIVQLGYVAAAYLSPLRHAHRRPHDPRSVRASARD